MDHVRSSCTAYTDLRSLISFPGEKKITPASPDEVARIIAETQKKLSEPASEAIGTPLVPMASPEEIAKVIAETQRRMQTQTTTSSGAAPSEFSVPMATAEEINKVIADTQKKLREQSFLESSVKVK
jgi:hypothetical protein